MRRIDLSTLKLFAQKTEQNNISFGKWLKKRKPFDLDYVTRQFGEQIFKQINCIECANCCKTLGPRITTRDINNIAKYLHLSTNQFIDKYLIIDEDNDYVFKSMPCPFLDNENYCTIYQHRPQACKEYPHLDRRKFVQIIDISLKNRNICPAVFEAFVLLRKHYKQ